MARGKRISQHDDSVPAEAKKRIAENKRTQNKSLDLSECRLTAVPAEVAELLWLESLDLHGNKQLSDLAPLASLAQLQMLYVYDTRVSDLAPLAGLTLQQTLDPCDTLVSDLAPLASLAQLQSLN